MEDNKTHLDAIMYMLALIVVLIVVQAVSTWYLAGEQHKEMKYRLERLEDLK